MYTGQRVSQANQHGRPTGQERHVPSPDRVAGICAPSAQVFGGIALDHVDHQLRVQVDQARGVAGRVLPVGLQELRLVDTECGDGPHVCRVVHERSAVTLDGVHDRPPAHPELVDDTGDRPCQLAHLAAGLDDGAAS